jgi:hypothetical protein
MALQPRTPRAGNRQASDWLSFVPAHKSPHFLFNALTTIGLTNGAPCALETLLRPAAAAGDSIRGRITARTRARHRRVAESSELGLNIGCVSRSTCRQGCGVCLRPWSSSRWWKTR